MRGTTSREIIQMARDAGAGRVYIASAAPPVRFPNVYGIDMPTKEELLAHRHTNFADIATELGADRIFYQDLPDLIASIADESISCGGNVRENFSQRAPLSIPCHAMPYHAIPCHAIPNHTKPYQTIPYQTIPYHAIPCNAMQYHTVTHTTPHQIRPDETIQ